MFEGASPNCVFTYTNPTQNRKYDYPRQCYPNITQNCAENNKGTICDSNFQSNGKKNKTPHCLLCNNNSPVNCINIKIAVLQRVNCSSA